MGVALQRISSGPIFCEQAGEISQKHKRVSREEAIIWYFPGKMKTDCNLKAFMVYFGL
jgi:hypothetical protein